jgi:hypothetical protein
MSFENESRQQILEAQIAVAKEAGGHAFFSSGDPEVDAALAVPMNPSSTNQTAFKTIYDTETGEAREEVFVVEAIRSPDHFAPFRPAAFMWWLLGVGGGGSKA